MLAALGLPEHQFDKSESETNLHNCVHPLCFQTVSENGSEHTVAVSIEQHYHTRGLWHALGCYGVLHSASYHAQSHKYQYTASCCV